MRRVFFGLFSLLATASAGLAITIEIDYGFDGGYFSAAAAGSPEDQAKKTIEAAAKDLSDALNAESASLNAVDSMSFDGSDSGLNVLSNFTWDLRVPDPVDPGDKQATHTLSGFSLGNDIFKIFAGAAIVLDSADALGEGAPASAAYTFDLSDDIDDATSISAIQSALDYSNGILLRGAGPVITAVDAENVNNQLALKSGTVVKLPLKLGALAGFLTFKKGETWNYDHTQLPGAGQYDLYTVMLHEMIHTLGFGTSETWRSKVTNADKDWTGAFAIAANAGVGAGLINETNGGDADGAHIKNGTMSEILGTNTAQEAVMTAAIAKGVRRKLTKLDIAFLKDLGYGPATAAPTPPPTPTPTPAPTVEPTPVPVAPQIPIVAGPSKIKSTKPKVKLGGTLLSEGAYVMYKIGNGAYLKAKGAGIWTINLKLKPGKYTVTLVAFDPATGLMSRAKKVTVVVTKPKPKS